MAKPELGLKRTCVSCNARFYDLGRDPAICPKCGAEQPSELSRLRRNIDVAPENDKPDPNAENTDDADLAGDDDDDADDVMEDTSDLDDGDDDLSADIEVDNDRDNDEN